MPSKSGIIGQLTNQILGFIELFLQMILGTRKMKESYSESGLSVCTYDSERRLRVKKMHMILSPVACSNKRINTVKVNVTCRNR